MAEADENPRVFLDIEIGGEPIGRYDLLSLMSGVADRAWCS